MYLLEIYKILPMLAEIVNLEKIVRLFYERLIKINEINSMTGPSRGGLEVKAWTDTSLHSALVSSNPV